MVWLGTRPPTDGGPLHLELERDLADHLRQEAAARHLTPQALAANLVARALAREVFRAQAEAALAGLSPREREVARLAARGYTNQRIAEVLFISLETVKTHMRRGLNKLGLRSKTELRLLLRELSPD